MPRAELEDAYAAAWSEWDASGEAQIWNAVEVGPDQRLDPTGD